MQRAASILLGLLLALGSTLSGLGHLHAAPGGHEPGGLHVDHVHFDSGHAAHHSHRDSPPDLTADHSGEDAVTLSLSSTEAMPKRQLPALAPVAASGGPPPTPAARTHGISERQPSVPSPSSRPPGRAPPAY